MVVKNKIKLYREKYNITQEELAKRLGKSKQYISKIEREKVNLSIGLALQIVNAFKLLSKEKTFGLQMIRLQVEDLFYLE